MFMEYEREYVSLFDMGCRPLDPMVHCNFCSDREILCLKRHFVLVPFSGFFLFFLFIFSCWFLSKLYHFLLFSDSKVDFSFLFLATCYASYLISWGYSMYTHRNCLIDIFHMAFCLKFLCLDP